jgi:hypothetical protein
MSDARKVNYMRQLGTLSMEETLLVISRCWEQAEEQLQAEISNYAPGADEEQVTRLFHMRLAARLQDASGDRRIEEAFRMDLMRSFRQVWGRTYALRELPRGLVANVTLHERHIEKVSGGDLGFVVARPTVQLQRDVLRIGDYRRGLLVQAKLQRRNGKWGQFTARQREVLPGRLAYLALLLYSYADAERCTLQPFEWQLCENASFGEVEGWLRSGMFPPSTRARAIIQGLGAGSIGTDTQRPPAESWGVAG